MAERNSNIRNIQKCDSDGKATCGFETQKGPSELLKTPKMEGKGDMDVLDRFIEIALQSDKDTQKDEKILKNKIESTENKGSLPEDIHFQQGNIKLAHKFNKNICQETKNGNESASYNFHLSPD